MVCHGCSVLSYYYRQTACVHGPRPSPKGGEESGTSVGENKKKESVRRVRALLFFQDTSGSFFDLVSDKCIRCVQCCVPPFQAVVSNSRP